MQLKSRHLVILHSLSLKGQTVYGMAHGDVGVITGATEMGIHHACKALEHDGLITTTERHNGAKKSLVKTVTKKGKKLLEEIRTEPVKDAPTTICDFYVLDHIKNDPQVHEALICVLVRQRAKAKTDIAKEWFDYAIARYSKTV